MDSIRIARYILKRIERKPFSGGLLVECKKVGG